MSVKPYSQSSSSKKEQVREMFDNISHSYDLLNHFLSLGIDRSWRKTAIKKLNSQNPRFILDVATGTGDFAIEAQKINPEKIIGIDLSNGMLEKGRIKIKKRGLESKIELLQADSEKLPFENDYFDAAIVAFGVRNFENLSKGLEEICRVLTPGGTFIILEFSKPKGLFKFFFNFYFKRVLPSLGRMFSKDQRAYTYLPQSVQEFPEGVGFMTLLEEAGFNKIEEQRLTFGVCSLYSAIK